MKVISDNAPGVEINGCDILLNSVQHSKNYDEAQS
jgi:hypothetical protein